MPQIIKKGEYIQLTSSDGINTNVTHLVAITDFDLKKELQELILKLTEVIVGGNLVAYEIDGKRFSLENTKKEIIEFYVNAFYYQNPLELEKHLINKELVMLINFRPFNDMDDIID